MHSAKWTRNQMSNADAECKMYPIIIIFSSATLLNKNMQDAKYAKKMCMLKRLPPLTLLTSAENLFKYFRRVSTEYGEAVSD